MSVYGIAQRDGDGGDYLVSHIYLVICGNNFNLSESLSIDPLSIGGQH